ncbi:hypothetical protein, partial [Streptomyces sp. IBSBF 2390]|uniref:hypothetical protein n=1 Tax=Streptomyces sp. IBSBF 2390 TaxID=2903533 RepID=UPI002FDC14FE
SAVILKLFEDVIKTQTRPVLTNSSTDWESFKIELDSKIDLPASLQSIEELEESAELFVNLIQKAAWANTKINVSKKKSTSYPEHIMIKVKEKRRARKRWIQSRDPADKNILNNLTQQLRRAIKLYKESSMKDY